MITDTDNRLSKLFNRLTDLPTLPAVVDKLLQLSETEATFKDFARLISADAGLSAKVLKLVNSAFYSLRAPVSDLAHACSIIGTRTIKSMVLSVSVMQLFKRRCEGFESTLFWRHSLAAAVVSRKLIQTLRLPAERSEDAYIAGLLHATGIPLLVQYFPQEYAQILVRIGAGAGSILELEEQTFGATHPEVGGRVAGHWRLPGAISTAIKHHRTDAQALPADLPEELLKLVEILRVAEFWTRRSGLPAVDVERLDPSASMPIPEWMGLDAEGLDATLGDVPSTVADMESLFSS